MKSFIKNYLAKLAAGRTDDGIMITLPDPQKIDFQTAMMEDLLMRNGIDPRAITSEKQLVGIINQIRAFEKKNLADNIKSGITNTKSAKIFNKAGEELDPNKPIIGGTQEGKKIDQDFFIRNAESQEKKGMFDNIFNKMQNERKGLKAIDDDLPPPGSRGGPDDIAAPVQSQEETLKNMIEAENTKNIAAMKKRKMLDDAIEDASPGFADDIKYDADIVAENLAERMGLVYDDLPTKQRLDLYDQAYTGLSKKRFEQKETKRLMDDMKDIEDPEDFAKGGIARIGLGSGTIPGGYTDDAYKYIKEIEMDIAKAFKKYKAGGGTLDFDTYSNLAKGTMSDKDIPSFKADGGIMRLGFKDGMNRRTFLKFLAGAASIPIVGKIFKPLKVGKTVTKVPIIKTADVAGKPEWFDQLVNKVILEGDDVTKQFATKEREIVHTTKIDDQVGGPEVRVTQDLDDGVVRVEYDSVDNTFEDTVQLQYKKPLPDEGDPNPMAEFEVSESGPVGRVQGPDDFDIDIDEVGGMSISDLNSDVSKLKAYATGEKPTMKELVKNIDRRKKAKNITEDQEAQMDAIIKRQGDYDPSDYDDFARGGIARMLGE